MWVSISRDSRANRCCTSVRSSGSRQARRAALAAACGHVTSAHPPFVCMWKDKSGITSLRLCFPQEPLKRSHCATRLCPCGFRFRRVVAMHEASPSRPFEPFRRARPGAFAAMRRGEGPYRFIQNRSRTSVVALKSNAAAEKSKDQLSRDFQGRSIFDFCNIERLLLLLVGEGLNPEHVGCSE